MNKYKAVNPLFYIITGVMIIMSILTLKFSVRLCILELMISIIAIITVFVGIKKNASFAIKVLQSTAKGLKLNSESTLSKFKTPMISVSKYGQIVWVNNIFMKKTNTKKDIIGENISLILGDIKLQQIPLKEKFDIEYNNKKFTVFGVEMDNCYIIYFIEDTYYKITAQKYEMSRPCVATILFDNREELLRDTEDEQLIQIVALVENTIQKWVGTTTGFFKKINDGKYIFVTEEKYIKQFEENKFDILNQIHEIKKDEHNFATISIGIGRATDTLREAEAWSRKALDMALGRGGDQVVIKSGSSYQFFGGSSKGIEKRNTVRARVIATTLIEHVRQSDKVFIMGHQFSDLDSVGSAVGLYSAISKGQNKETHIVIDINKTLSKVLIDTVKEEMSGQEDIFISPQEALSMHTKDSLLIVVDTHTPGFLESSELYEHIEKVVVIDHHRMMVHRIKNALIFYHEPYASSTSEMVTELVQYMGEDNIRRTESEALLAGIMLDTKNFVLRTGTRTFQAAAFLRSKGADTVKVKRMFSNSIDEYKTRFEIVSQAEIFNNCAVACTEEVSDDIRVVAAQAADELLGLQGVKASFVMYPIDNGVNISARSFGAINVQVIMEELGGGGHQSMAGAQMYAVSMTDARECLINLINKIDTKDN